MSTTTYSIPSETRRLLVDGIIKNRLHSSLPADIEEAANSIEFIGADLPIIPINWRFAESVSSLKGFQAAMLNVLLKRKYGVDYQKIIIDTDHAQLFIMSVWVSVIDPEHTKTENRGFFDSSYLKYIPSTDKHGAFDSPYRQAVTNIYKTRDNKFFHVHGSMDPRPSQDALGLPHDMDFADVPAASEMYQSKVSTMDAADLDTLMNDRYRQAGTICLSKEEYRSSPHGQANAHVGLYEVHHIPNEKQKPSWWSSPILKEGQTEPGPSRPLFGLKIIDLTRVIAAPAVSRELAELGASVLRITSPNITDISMLNMDMGWGKWNASLDLKVEKDRDTLRALILEADVVVDGYRPGVMEKYGFGKEDILELFVGKDRGIIYAHENCYGWNGPWSYRSGWQQISDANCGVSLAFGQAMGNDEPVTPVFPNSDFNTGISGAVGVLQALIQKAENGGSYVVDIALNYYSQWLVDSCSTYPEEIWQDVWSRNGRRVFRHHDSMQVTLPALMGMLKENSPDLFRPEFFEDRENKALGVKIRTVKPILQFPEGLVKTAYNVGTRGNGVDKPEWPEDLLTEILA